MLVLLLLLLMISARNSSKLCYLKRLSSFCYRCVAVARGTAVVVVVVVVVSVAFVVVDIIVAATILQRSHFQN